MTRTLAAAALAAAALVSSSVPAHAAPTLCYMVWRDGTVPPPVFAGPVCVPFYEGPVNCQTIDFPVTNLVVLHVYECLPR